MKRAGKTVGGAVALTVLLLLGSLGLACPSPGASRKEPAMDARGIVDRALKAHGDLGVYGDLSAGLEALEKEFTVRIVEDGDLLRVDAGPHSGAGHDFTFSVDRKTGEIGDVFIGEVEPEPEPDTEPVP